MKKKINKHQVKKTKILKMNYKLKEKFQKSNRNKKMMMKKKNKLMKNKKFKTKKNKISLIK